MHPVTRRTPLSRRLPWLLPVAVCVHKSRRYLQWWTSDVMWATDRSPDPLPHEVMAHASVLLRELSPDVMHLQHAKVTNLRLAGPHVDGLLLRPGETFSFNRTVGNCTRRKGYVDGLRLAGGETGSGVGGGICQIANMVHWLVLHSPLTVVERSEHTVDPFPDAERVVPWGVGCSIVHNYVDLVVRNDTELTFQLRVGVGGTHLHGALLSDHPLEHRYRVEARDERFERDRGTVHRSNEIWRVLLDPATGRTTGEELVRRNRAVVGYAPDPARVVDVDARAQATTRPRNTTRTGRRSTDRSSRGSAS